MSIGSSKTNVIEAHPNFDTIERYFLAFKFDSEFFNDILDVVSSNGLNEKLSFPVEDNYFDLVSYHHKSVYNLRRRLTSEKFKYIIKPENENITVRLHIISNLFYFTAETQSGVFTTDEYSVEHITMWLNGKQIVEAL